MSTFEGLRTATPVALRLLELRVAWLLNELGWGKKKTIHSAPRECPEPVLVASCSSRGARQFHPIHQRSLLLQQRKKDVCCSELLRFLKTFPDTAKTF